VPSDNRGMASMHRNIIIADAHHDGQAAP